MYSIINDRSFYRVNRKRSVECLFPSRDFEILFVPVSQDMNIFIAVSILVFILSHNESYGSYRKGLNYLKCPPGWGVKDIKCERCISGKTYSSTYSSSSPCIRCSKCGIGLYEAHKCSRIKDTFCDDCTRIIYNSNLKENNDFSRKCSYLFVDSESFFIKNRRWHTNKYNLRKN